jgi:uncharacterized protein (UPF0332 family)/predicted nucleotidyltransferase
MEFRVERVENPNINRYSKDELNLAYEFSKKIYDEFGTFLKAVILFGSVTRREKGQGVRDIDILVIVDDTAVGMGAELVEAYRVILEKVIAQTSTRLHVTSLKLTSFWEYVKAGDPVAVNILREGVALLDTGFFDPLRALLLRGRIRPTTESIWTYFARAPRTLHNSRWHLMQATIDLYWAVIDAAHAALMKLGETPPSPDHVADLIEQRMVKEKLIDKKYADTMRFFYDLQKKIMYRDIKEISGPEYERYAAKAKDFVDKMEGFISKK